MVGELPADVETFAERETAESIDEPAPEEAPAAKKTLAERAGWLASPTTR